MDNTTMLQANGLHYFPTISYMSSKLINHSFCRRRAHLLELPGSQMMKPYKFSWTLYILWLYSSQLMS